jgi:transposase
MEALLPSAGPAPSCSAPSVPTEPCPVCPRLVAEFEPWRQAAYWQGMHQRAVQREQRLQQEVHSLQARVRSLEQRLFGRKTENAAALPEAAAPTSPPQTPRPRGQQRGRPGPKRRDYTHLPVVEETLDVPADQQQCPQCGQAFVPFPGTDDSTVLEVEVRAHRRLIRRRRYRPTCGCGCNAGIITAPPPPKVLPKSMVGVSIWVRVLLDKYLFYRPTYRLLDDLATEGLSLSLGTITDGLQRLLPLLEPLYDALIERSREQTLWHADETRWLVYASVEGKVGYRWYLWVFHGGDVVVFVLASGRAHDVPEEHLGPLAEGILVVDRYAAYKALPQVKDGRIVLAFCWAHVRRDFVEAARSWPALQRWGLDWVERIGAAYRCNDARLTVRDDPAAFAQADEALRRQMTALAEQNATELRENDLHPTRRKTLESLQTHWQGLTVFVDHPDVPMDNNTAERVQRGPVVGRKNYYGSGAEWSGRLAAILFSLFQTLALGHLNPRLWLTAYLDACAAAYGQAPADAVAYLPWNLTEEKKQAWRSQPAPANSS